MNIQKLLAFIFFSLSITALRAQTGISFFEKNVSVSNSVMVELTDASGNSLPKESVYKVHLVTRGTGTNTGAEYLVWYNVDTSLWNLREVTLAGSISNHPLLTVDDNVVKIRTNHSNNYRVRVLVQEMQVDETDAEPDVFGSSYHWQRKGNGLYYTDGMVGIGTSSPGSWKLAVNGNIRAKEIKVETGWSDFVFEKDYRLPTLEEVEQHIKEKGHLKDIPSAKEVAENGIFLGEMDAKLLRKIEELTLYVLELKKENRQQHERINSLIKENRKQQKEIDQFKKQSK
ncbi:hypothetical protein LS482_09570 [Sinomicrobium kalidii]|uniref:hypothetical protein n=1 Tax=Sinomicrobium kalidii TaxID=2900738 RepID=UPI001E57332D|nr:hypothetical protein [Sinomicrobium kalidii]UGU18115.1 hypothetical protein LS482_09570 [Sinomicrobium kalidii]